MTVAHLIKMANEITRFYEAYTDRVEARNEIAGHLQRFWDPRMRQQIIDHATKNPDTGLLPLALEALEQLKPDG